MGISSNLVNAAAGGHRCKCSPRWDNIWYGLHRDMTPHIDLHLTRCTNYRRTWQTRVLRSRLAGVSAAGAAAVPLPDCGTVDTVPNVCCRLRRACSGNRRGCRAGLVISNTAGAVV